MFVCMLYIYIKKLRQHLSTLSNYACKNAPTATATASASSIRCCLLQRDIVKWHKLIICEYSFHGRKCLRFLFIFRLSKIFKKFFRIFFAFCTVAVTLVLSSNFFYPDPLSFHYVVLPCHLCVGFSFFLFYFIVPKMNFVFLIFFVVFIFVTLFLQFFLEIFSYFLLFIFMMRILNFKPDAELLNF